MFLGAATIGAKAVGMVMIMCDWRRWTRRGEAVLEILRAKLSLTMRQCGRHRWRRLLEIRYCGMEAAGLDKRRRNCLR